MHREHVDDFAQRDELWESIEAELRWHVEKPEELRSCHAVYLKIRAWADMQEESGGSRRSEN